MIYFQLRSHRNEHWHLGILCHANAWDPTHESHLGYVQHVQRVQRDQRDQRAPANSKRRPPIRPIRLKESAAGDL